MTSAETRPDCSRGWGGGASEQDHNKSDVTRSVVGINNLQQVIKKTCSFPSLGNYLKVQICISFFLFYVSGLLVRERNILISSAKHS